MCSLSSLLLERERFLLSFLNSLDGLSKKTSLAPPPQGVPEVDPAVLKYRAPTQPQPHAAAAAPPPPLVTQLPGPTSATQIPHIPEVQGPITADPEQVRRSVPPLVEP